MHRKILLITLSLWSVLASAELQLVGKAMLEYSIFKIDVYEVSYFKDKKTKVEKLTLNYKRDVAAKHSLEGWKVGR